MIRTWTDVADIPPLSDREAARLARTEYARMLDVLRGLDADDWSRPTPCDAWDVRALVGHVVGATQQYTSTRRGLVNQVQAQLRARRTGEPLVDAWTGVQVDRTAGLSTAELVARFDAVRDRAVRHRMRTPRPLRGVELDDGFGNTFTLGQLTRVVATRDTWLHRDDLARATGRPMLLTAEQDGRIVADVVAEWARRHGRPVRLRLDGPAGGTWSAGSGGEEIEMDAVAFCRALSGRAPADGLLAQGVPF